MFALFIAAKRIHTMLLIPIIYQCIALLFFEV